MGREVKLSSGKVFLRDKDYIKRSIADPDAEIVKGFSDGLCQQSNPLSGKKLEALVEFLTGPKTGNASSPAKEPEEKK